ncbi:hypothetical protein KFK09_012310 [Dendrobium nobile]|uniref:Uncharacterized protein n=1 Tax=Dendrobium nobile TaxID=94219 RepID=A0A8T3BKF1_DENNO|nr:hypothetical protein KFK09_012310 [Dendrobium nobile]
MKLDAELYDYSEQASKVTFDCNKQFSSAILKLDNRGGKIERDVILDEIEGKVCQSIDLSPSCNDSNAYYLSGKSDPTNNCMNESVCRAAPCPCATSEISLIAQEDLFYMDKTVTDVELPHLSVSTKAAPTVKDICVDEGVQMFEKILVEYDKVDQAVFSTSNFPRVNGNSALMEEKRENENSEDLKSLPTHERLDSLGKILERDVGDTDLNERMDKTSKNDLRSFLFTEHLAEQRYSSNSISERRPLDTTEITAFTLPAEEIIQQRSHFLEEFNTDFPRADSSSHNDSTFENQALRQKHDQVVEEEDLTTMTASCPEKAKESNQIGTVSSHKDLLEKEKPSEFVATSDKSNRIDNTNGASDGVAFTSDLEAGGTSIVGNENQVINNQQTVQSQNGVETEEAVSDGTTSARSSFSHLAHGESNLLGPANFSGSITTSSHIPCSANISLRSESSTTSGHSFAFPLLQPEWSSSPIRMAKADRRRLRKHRWKSAFTCCKF